ncbi:MAG TPA: hypothetical protein VEL07_10745, partial [Planctomycetota bacterium]|nr:hypothetical protein [Planctomycetota bacterium]
MRAIVAIVFATLALIRPLHAEARGPSPDELRVLADFSAAVAAPQLARLGGDDATRLTHLAQARRRVLARLVRDDPRSALAHAIPRGRRAAIAPAVDGLLEEEISAEGTYSVIATNTGEPGRRSVRRTAVIGGRTYEVSTFERGLAQGSSERRSLHGIAIDGVLALSPDRLRHLRPDETPSPDKRLAEPACPVSGKLAGANQESADGDDDILVESGDTVYPLCSALHAEDLEARLADQEGGAAPSGNAPPQASAWSIGTKTLLYIIARFPEEVGSNGQPVWPATISQAQSATLTCSNLLSASSYGLTRLEPTFVQVTMPNPKSYYQSRADGYVLGEARTAATGLGYNAFAYDLDVVLYSGIWGFQGQAYVGARGCWLQNTSPGVMLHELGHNLGLWHANAWISPSVIGAGTNQEYGDHHSGMSGQLGNQFNAYERWTMGWLAEGNVRTVAASGTHRLIGCDVRPPAAGELFALRVTKDRERDYWISHRDSLNNAWARSGVLLHWDAWSISGIGHSNGGGNLLDTTPSSTNGRKDAALIYGRTFSDTFAGIHITPLPTGIGGNGSPT